MSAQQTEPSSRSSDQLHKALLEYASSPGKYPVALRQPALLFSSIREILQIAAGREPMSGADADQGNAELRLAACFFTRTALLAPGADHYALLGLDRDFDGAELKDRYRLLMRLIHPDFAGGASNLWPADAAVRVNLAHDVLSSAVQRREYDARLAAPSSIPAPRAPVEYRRIKPSERPSFRAAPRSRLKHLAIICSVAGGSLVLISLFVARPDSVQLVQRVSPAVRSPAVEPAQEPAAVAVARMSESVSREPMTPAAAQQPAVPQPAVRNEEFAQIAKVAEAAPAPAAKPAPAPLPQIPERAQLSSSVSGAATVALPAIDTTPPRPAPAPAVAVYQPPQPSPMPAPIAVTPPPPAPVSEPRSAPKPVAAPISSEPIQPRPAFVPGPTLADAQPLLANLLQQLESGRGEKLINLLDREARSKPAAQALSQHYDSLVEGMQPVRLTHVEFKAEPADGRLLVTGHIRLHLGEQTIGSIGKKMVLRAEFASREGTVVMTGLSGAAGN